jgi:hypothetical protein
MYLLLAVLIIIVIILWFNCDNKENFGAGYWMPPYNNLNYSYYSVDQYDPLEEGTTFPMRDQQQLDPSDPSISSQSYYDQYAPTYIS